MKNFFLAVTLFSVNLLHAGVQSEYPADITFMIADLKYNQADGIKICEIQQGARSKFSGYDRANEGVGLIAKMYCEALKPWHDNFFYIADGIAEHTFFDEFKKNGWVEISSIKELGGKKSTIHSSDISQYHGLLYARSNKLGKKKEAVKLNDVLLMDQPSFPTQHNKLLMSELFDQDDVLKSYKPRWKSYKTKYSKRLTAQILEDFKTDIVVIKPLSCCMGQGVILLHKKHLDNTLKLLFKNKNKLNALDDPSYLYWANSKDSHFLVEEFYESDPIIVPHLDNKRYDGTLRTAFLLIYHEGEISVQVLDSYWNLPFYSVDAKGTLNQKHKTDYLSVGKFHYSAKVSEETSSVVHKELEEILPLLYKQMLLKK